MSNARDIKQRLLPHIRAVCQHLLPRGYFDGTNWRVGSVQGESGQSLSVCCEGERAGFWKDFAASDDHRGDIFKLWMLVRRIPFADVLEEAQIWLDQGAPTMAAPVSPEDPWRIEKSLYIPAPMPAVVSNIWQQGQNFLAAKPAIQLGLDQLRGWPLGTTAALSRLGLVACIHLDGEPHWAFPVQFPTTEGTIHIGFHARPVKQNPDHKSPWMYRPNPRVDRIGIRPVPFVLGADELNSAELVVVTEGQWDAIAWAAAAGWLLDWPRGVTVFGLRGATSWRVFLTHWGNLWPTTAKFFLVPDGDEAGQDWHGRFATDLRQRVGDVQIMTMPAGLDFSDLNTRKPFTPADLAQVLRDFNLYPQQK